MKNVKGFVIAAGLLLCFVIVAARSVAQGGADAGTRPSQVAAQSGQTEEAHKPNDRQISLPQAALLGVVEGVTEYLPVSSTGHLILAGTALGLTHRDENGRLVESDAISAFDIVIQLGAILAVLGLYRRRVWQMAQGLVGRNADGLRLLGLLMVAFIPAAVMGLTFHRTIKANLFSPIPVCIALAVGGVAMILLERWHHRRVAAARKSMDCGAIADGPGGELGPAPARARHAAFGHGIDVMTFRQALFVGVFQCLALWPGTSRSMVTILAALLIGLDMMAAAEFSFLLALPTLGAATLYEGAIYWHELVPAAGVDGLLVGLVVSGIVAAIAVKGFVRWLTHHGMIPFGIYRILLAAVLIVYFSVSGR